MKRITVIGRGSSAAITALEYYLEGFEVEVIAKGPEPTKYNIGKDEFMCSSLTGPLNIQRYITGLEGHPRNSFAYNQFQTADWTQLRRQPISKGGRLNKPIEEFSLIHQEKINKRISHYKSYDINKQKNEYNNRIEKNTYSIKRWKNLINTHPQLFQGTQIQGFESGVLKLFKDVDYFNLTKKVYQKRKLYNKVYQDRENYLYGFREEGFNISQFANVIINIKDYLKEKGVKFHFNREVTNINLTQDGKLKNIILDTGKIIDDGNFSFHLGAYNTALQGKKQNHSDIFPVGGLRTTIELNNTAADMRSKNPIKIHTSKENEMYGRDINIANISSIQKNTLLAGYGYIICETPEQKNGISSSTKEFMHKRFEKNIINRIPKNDIKAITHSENICFRSFSINDRETLTNTDSIKNGKVIFCSGGNTGTTTMVFADSKKSVDIINELFI